MSNTILFVTLMSENYDYGDVIQIKESEQRSRYHTPYLEMQV